MNQIIDPANDHDAIWLLLPWYANGRIDEQQRARIDAHMRICTECHDELLVQRKICQAMAASNPDIEQLPTASLRHLWQKIDSHEKPMDIDMPVPVAHRPALSWRFPKGLAASLAAVLVAALGFMVFNRIEFAHNAPADYYTVTSPAPRVPQEVIRAVFAPVVTMADVQRILDEAQLQIIAGPTPAGVYSLAKTSKQSVNESLQQLRQHTEVLFAEPTAAAATSHSVALQ